MQPINDFKDPTDLTKWVVWSLYAQLLFAALMIYSEVSALGLFSDIESSNFSSEAQMVAAAESHDSQADAIALGYIITFILSGILILTWIHRANRNARALGARDMKFTPGWSVGWYFVPILSFWKPYQAMKKIWKASSGVEGWQNTTVPPLFFWWWLFWLAANISVNFSMRLSMRADEIPELIFASKMTIASEIIGIALTLVFLKLVRDLHAMQMARATAQGTSDAQTDPFEQQDS